MSNSYSKEFKRSAVDLLLSIIQRANPQKSIKYYQFFQKNLGISDEEFELFEQQNRLNQLENRDIICRELGNNNHKIMQFLMMLNRCIIIDGCELKSYQRFEEVRDSFIEKF